MVFCREVADHFPTISDADACPQSASVLVLVRGGHSVGHGRCRLRGLDVSESPVPEDAITYLGLAAETVFVLVFQEKTPPYLITVAQLDPMALRVGRELNRRAIEDFRRCSEPGHWPGHADSIRLLSLPA
jgi:hypothetical protein